LDKNYWVFIRSGGSPDSYRDPQDPQAEQGSAFLFGINGDWGLSLKAGFSDSYQEPHPDSYRDPQDPQHKAEQGSAFFILV
jgi:hypothetical protein